MKIFLDLDGVLGDFVGASAKLMGFDPRIVTTWDYYPLIGTTQEEFWNRIHSEGSRFWEEIEPYCWAKDLYEQCKKIAPTVILTSPSDHPSCVHGKAVWLKKHLGVGPSGYFMGSSKEFFAGPESVLIDDGDHNVEKFRANGGRSILFPQPWNKNREWPLNPVTFTMEILTEWHQEAVACSAR